MDARDSIEELHQLAEHRRAKRMLRASGWGALAFGGINAVIAIYWLQFSLINIILLLIAMGMLFVGFWELLLPMAEAFILDGIVAIALGLWNICITIFEAAAGVPVASIQWAIFGGCIIAWGVSRFISYRRLADALRVKPDADAMRRLDDIVEQIKKAISKDDPNVIGFRVAAKFMKPQQDWKGQLAEHAAVFIDKRGHDIMVAHKDDVEIRATGKVLIGKTLKVSIRVAEHTLQGTLSPESFDRFEEWKERDDDEVTESERVKTEDMPDQRIQEKPGL